MLKIVKEKALENHIPIIMDDTLEKIEEILNKNSRRYSRACENVKNWFPYRKIEETGCGQKVEKIEKISTFFTFLIDPQFHPQEIHRNYT